MERYNLQNMFAVVKEYFKKEYGYEGNEITLRQICEMKKIFIKEKLYYDFLR